MRRIIDTIKCNTCSGLQQLLIYKITLTDGDVNCIGNCLKHNTTIQKLIMVHTEIIDNVILIAEAIKVNTTLLMLDISYNITYNGGVAIGDALKYNNQLQELNISYNNITLDGVVYLTEYVKVNAILRDANDAVLPTIWTLKAKE